MPTSDASSGGSLLDIAYGALDLRGSDLIEVVSGPAESTDPSIWRELGEWLLLGARVGAERIFFVRDDPVFVFSSLPSQASEQEVMALYRRAWSMARPRCLFVAVGPELRVYGLDAPPVGPGEPGRQIEPLEIVDRAADVANALRRFHRDRLESGAAFEDADLRRAGGRADQRLLRDVSAAAAALVDGGLDVRHAHALIERAILIRYLEDRGVLTDGYYSEVAARKAGWRKRLETPETTLDFGAQSLFIRCLADKSLAYALFEHLARDFNGDLFVPETGEQGQVTDSHLCLLRDLLTGVAGASQEPLFLWAYDFSVVPTSLVSSMYELFYRQEFDDPETGTYYTPPELAEYVIADLLRPEILDRAPRVCDPACGSGIFLVEAYGRIVRHEAAMSGKRLTTRRLRELLLERIAGCDINESAIQLAAFSLYIAFLNHQTPQDIRQAGPLPPLIDRGPDAPAPLVVADAFSATTDEAIDEALSAETLPWASGSFGVIVANPPWTEPRGKNKSLGERWAECHERPIGDRSPSQLFLWRVLHLLAEDGVATLLVSAKVLFNVRTKSRAFRCQWLNAARLERVVNFSQVRRDFFEHAISPFALVRFRRANGSPDGPVIYETARPVPRARRGSAALARLDRRVVDQRSLRDHDHLWKTYSAGTHRDEALVARLGLDEQLRGLIPQSPSSWFGYQRGRAGAHDARETPTEWRELRSLKTFESWGSLQDAWFEPFPTHVKRGIDPRLIKGPRLLVRRGVSSKFGVHARFVTEPMAFRHTVYGFPISPDSEWAAKVALGTLLSTLGRYWLYMVSGSWGSRNDDIRVDELLDLPLRLDRDHPATLRILTAVERLPHSAPRQPQLSQSPSAPDVSAVLKEIDDAVSDLFDLTPSERDLVSDFWASRHTSATQPVDMSSKAEGQLTRYLDVFDTAWRPVLGEDAEFDRQIWRDAQAQVIAAVFRTRSPDKPATKQPEDQDAWSAVLERFDPAYPQTLSGTLLSYGMLRAVTDSAIVIVKRNESQLWSATAAREDAEATIAQAMRLQQA
jgi:hypothetical protein